MLLLLTMFALGLLLGFVGAGGSGFIIAVLTVFFGIPVHTALGTSLAAMVFSTLSGAYSHFREGNVVLKSGLVVGGFGGMGAYIGARIAHLIPAEELTWMTGSVLLLSALLLWIRIFVVSRLSAEAVNARKAPAGIRFWLFAFFVGMVTGMLSGTFGIGSTPFIQVGLLVFFAMTVQQSAGTTLLVILPIALVGALGYYSVGYLDVLLFAKVVVGTMIGSYIGAKFTNRLHPLILKTAMVGMPVTGGILMLVS